MVSCTTIEAQIVFEMLLALVTDQLAIAGQLGRFALFWKVVTEPEVEAFPCFWE